MTAILPAEQAQRILEQAPLPLVVLDGNDRIISYNLAFERLLGPAAAAQLCGREIRQLSGHPAQSLFASKTRAHWHDTGGGQRHYQVATIELDQARARLYIDVSRQAELESQEKKLKDDLRQNSLTDPATGLLNQRGLLLALEPQVARSRRYNNPMSVIMMALSDFANAEKCSHLEVARLLKDQLRWADLIGRSPGGEFLLILPETSPEAAAALADKLTRLIGELSTRLGEPPAAVSYGITGWRRSDNAGSLINRAAAALAQARAAQDSQAIAL